MAIYDLDVEAIHEEKEMDPTMRNVASHKRNATGRKPKRQKSRRAGYCNLTVFDQESVDFDANKVIER